MNAFTSFEISAAGMSVERLRLDVAAVNLANANTTRSADGTVFRPLRVSARGPVPFDSVITRMLTGRDVVGDVEITAVDVDPRMVFDPGHPDADARGFVAYPGINPVSEMISLISVTRAYEANVRALNAAKSMALKALEIGGDR